MMFSLINETAKQIKLIIDQGINLEINHVLELQSNIKEYKIEEIEDKYKISIKLNDYSFAKAKEIFYTLVRFIQYNATFFAYNEVDKQSVEFLLVSASEDKTGYCCQINFSK